MATGGYQNAAALPSAELLKEIEYVDASIGDIVNALKDAGIYDDTLIIITAKHGESPIDPSLYVADGANTPATLLGSAIPSSESPLNASGIGATEDDVSVLWLNKGASVTAAVQLLETECGRDRPRGDLLWADAGAELQRRRSRAGSGSALAGHYRDPERRRDLLGQHRR